MAKFEKFDLMCAGADVVNETYGLVKHFKSEDAKTERMEIQAEALVRREKEITERVRTESMRDVMNFREEQISIRKREEREFLYKMGQLKKESDETMEKLYQERKQIEIVEKYVDENLKNISPTEMIELIKSLRD